MVGKHLRHNPQRHIPRFTAKSCSILPIVDPVRDIVERAHAPITSRYTVIVGDRGRPSLRESTIESDRVWVGQENIGTGRELGPMVVCAVEDQGDGMVRVNRMDEVSSVFGRIERCRGSVRLVASVPDKKALSRSELFDLGLDQGEICETCRVSVELPLSQDGLSYYVACHT